MAKSESAKSESWEWVKAIVVALLLALAIRAFLFAPIVVDGQSMMPTLGHDDRMVVNKINYTLSEPERFDIIVFHAPHESDYIKRVIGVPGDSLYYEEDQLYVNDDPVDEPYLNEFKEQSEENPFTGDFDLEEVTGYEEIPEDHYFVLGDNRQHSKDGRHIGLVSDEDIVGEASFVFWPISDIRMAE
ncbi:signal peptidase I [Salisediminibacterium halotolerans]|uniref:Signal peptidase I n=1 Tax=Salisediminibacterium halotolerans TaxID=517425 RepID=A0A1H9Q135_9BACI|nr:MULTISPECIES: signal peptidase I [Salisediminibacterium]RLJ74242.1 signal peptidase I [Actinophytocola xinjiangensis]RPE87666.1 signal peptidase I [Salisediminibacterium halotolerans]TWG35079.1 signal peptidase I [Salisediminibacterium halotolerans]SER54167.1 signal peptidase I [Salisediminibacterium haloalkalitolerans]GEL06873.1 signal peptidase I [Salisediminibacterium halotolerans]